MVFQCPVCRGTGELVEWDEPQWGRYSNPCGACKTTGKVGIRWKMANLFWNWAPVWLVEWYGERKFAITKEQGE